MKNIERIAGIKLAIECWKHRIEENKSAAELKRCLAQGTSDHPETLLAHADCILAENIFLLELVRSFGLEIDSLKEHKIVTLRRPPDDLEDIQ